ncbi:hypothetical protein CWI39_0045p0050 [Hamiltosporidium magnivora]|uniref:Uncharacterized protein n=1 Tax=Hamiltosporidium magnivora TaxID=148818 RepID=A0A4Q9LNK5_9MICR|nr:hypothetical protein CWI39_0045p0050 [Hamiltosporidium magnivora]
MEEKIEDIIVRSKQKDVMLNKLTFYMKENGFYDVVCRHLEELASKDVNNGDEYNETYLKLFEFISENMPTEIYQKFYIDVKNFLDDYVHPNLE